MEEDKIQVFGNPDDYSLVETSTIGGEVAFGMDIVYQGNTIATLVGNTGFRYVDDNTVRFDLNINQDFEFV